MTARPLALLAVAAAGLVAPLAMPADAQTATPTVSTSPSELPAAGGRLTVTGSGYTAGQGVYVQFCAEPTGALGTASGRAANCNPDQSGDHTVWKTPIAADGTFSVELEVVPSFGSTNCATATCGVFTRRDHVGGATDFSQDAFAAVSFAASQAAPGDPETPATSETPAATGSGTGSTGGAELAATGRTSGLLAATGATLVAVGALVVTGTRRRRHQTA